MPLKNAVLGVLLAHGHTGSAERSPGAAFSPARLRAASRSWVRVGEWVPQAQWSPAATLGRCSPARCLASCDDEGDGVPGLPPRAPGREARWVQALLQLPPASPVRMLRQRRPFWLVIG